MIKTSFLRRGLSGFSLVAFVALCPLLGQAQTLLKVQYSGTSTATQPGFTNVLTSGLTVIEDSLGNDINVNLVLAGSAGSGFWNSGITGAVENYQYLYSRYAFAEGWDSYIELTLSGDGIAANTSYQFRGFYFSGGTYVATSTPVGGTSGVAVSGSMGSTAPTSDYEYSTIMNLVSNGSGEIVIRITANVYNGPRFNGFELSAVPEPSALLYAGMAGIGFLLAGRRRPVHRKDH